MLPPTSLTKLFKLSYNQSLFILNFSPKTIIVDSDNLFPVKIYFLKKIRIVVKSIALFIPPYLL